MSAFILFELLVKPFLYKMMGHNFLHNMIPIPLGKTITRKQAGREAIIPVAFADSGTAMPVKYHGSSHIHLMCGSDGLISIPVGITEIKKGTIVRVIQV